MKWEEIVKYFEEHKDSKDVQEFLAKLTKPLDLATVQAFLKDNPEAFKWLQSEKDRAVTKGIQTYEKDTLPGKISEATSGMERKPTAQEARIIELEKKDRDRDSKEARLTLENKALTLCNKAALPTELAKFFIDKDEEATEANVKAFQALFTAAVTAEVDKRLKANPNVPGGKQDKSDTTVNPWKKETFNLTKQGQIVKEDPVKAVKLAAEAGITLELE